MREIVVIVWKRFQRALVTKKATTISMMMIWSGAKMCPVTGMMKTHPEWKKSMDSPGFLWLRQEDLEILSSWLSLHSITHSLGVTRSALNV